MSEEPQGYLSGDVDMFEYLLDSSLEDDNEELEIDEEPKSYVSGIRDLELSRPTKTVQSLPSGLDFNHNYKENIELNRKINEKKESNSCYSAPLSDFLSNPSNDRSYDKKLDTYSRFHEDLSLMEYRENYKETESKKVCKKDTRRSLIKKEDKYEGKVDFKNPYVNDRFLMNKNVRRDISDYRSKSRVNREFNKIPGFVSHY